MEQSKVGTGEQQAVSATRRALIKAGWVVPVVLAVGIPRNALAQSASDGGGNGGGTDPGGGIVT